MVALKTDGCIWLQLFFIKKNPLYQNHCDDEARKNMKEALEFHMEGLGLEKLPN